MKRLYLLVLIFLVAVSAAWSAVSRAQAHAVKLADTPKGIPLPMATWNSPGGASPQASVQRVSTVTLHPFLPYQTSATHIHEAYSGTMGTLFTFDVGSFGIEHISNLTYAANDGVSCSHNASLLITCTGSAISQVTVDFDWTYIANDYAGNILWEGYRGYSTYPLDYTFYLIFPDPLVYVKPYSLEPISVTADQITWHLDNTNSLTGIAIFADPRVRAVYMPVVMR